VTQNEGRDDDPAVVVRLDQMHGLAADTDAVARVTDLIRATRDDRVNIRFDTRQVANIEDLPGVVDREEAE
jgi:hypothetical protein